MILGLCKSKTSGFIYFQIGTKELFSVFVQISEMLTFASTTQNSGEKQQQKKVLLICFDSK